MSADSISFSAFDIPAVRSKLWLLWGIFFLIMVPGAVVVGVALITTGLLPKGSTGLNVIFAASTIFLVAAAYTFIGRAVNLSRWARQAFAQFAYDNGFSPVNNYSPEEYLLPASKYTSKLEVRDVYEGTYLNVPLSVCHFTLLENAGRISRTLNVVALRFRRTDLKALGDALQYSQFAYLTAISSDYFWVKPIPDLFSKAAQMVKH